VYRELYGGPVTGKTFAVIGEDSPAGKQGATTGGHHGEGCRLQGRCTPRRPVPGPPATVGDWSPYANQLMKSNGGKPPDAISIGIFPTEIAPLAKALRDLGYKGRIFNSVMYKPPARTGGGWAQPGHPSPARALRDHSGAGGYGPVQGGHEGVRAEHPR